MPLTESGELTTTLGPAPQVLPAKQKQQSKPAGDNESLRNLPLTFAAAMVVVIVTGLAVIGFPYYQLSPEDRPFSPLHAYLRSSGTIGLKLGILGVCLFGVLFLYPLRKRWKWLGTIGKTRRWLNVHVLVGISAPLIITFHTTFKWNGLAGLAYWIMVSVACSGFVGRYLYSKIPRKLSTMKLTAEELEAETATLTSNAGGQGIFTAADFLPMLNLPTADEIGKMNTFRALAMMARLDLARPFQVASLRRRLLSGHRMVTTLGGFRSSGDERVETIVKNVRRLSGLLTAAAFLQRTERVFHLWHVVHRPFSLTFVMLIVVHVCVALSVGVR